MRSTVLLLLEEELKTVRRERDAARAERDRARNAYATLADAAGVPLEDALPLDEDHVATALAAVQNGAKAIERERLADEAVSRGLGR